MDRRGAILAASCVASFSVGFVVGYKGLESRLQTKYDKMLAEELEATKQFYARLHKKDEYSDVTEAASALLGPAADALREYQGKILDDHIRSEQAAMDRKILVGDADKPTTTVVVEETVTTEEPVTRNVWDQPSPNLPDDLPVYPVEMEVERRSEDRPYVITMEEFLANDPEHEQIDLTYYTCGTMADDSDAVIDAVEPLIGLNNLALFGVGSGSEDVVLVRNHRNKVDWEITKSTSIYQAVTQAEGLEHSSEDFQRIRRHHSGETILRMRRDRRGDDG